MGVFDVQAFLTGQGVLMSIACSSIYMCLQNYFYKAVKKKGVKYDYTSIEFEEAIVYWTEQDQIQI
jgi:hypothetical protein